MKPSHSEFAGELRGFRPEVAAELEDHLHEALERALAKGTDPARARAEALQAFGDLAELRHALKRSERSPIGFRRGTHWITHTVIAAWMGFGLLLLSRICAAPEPTLPSILACISAGLACTLLGTLLLRGGPRAFHLVRGGAVAAFVACGAAWIPAASKGLESACALHPWILTIGMITAILTAALPLIENATAAPPPLRS